MSWRERPPSYSAGSGLLFRRLRQIRSVCTPTTATVARVRYADIYSRLMRAQGGLDAVLRDAGGTGFPGREAVEIETTFCNERNSINIRPTGEYKGVHTI